MIVEGAEEVPCTEHLGQHFALAESAGGFEARAKAEPTGDDLS